MQPSQSTGQDTRQLKQVTAREDSGGQDRPHIDRGHAGTKTRGVLNTIISTG